MLCRQNGGRFATGKRYRHAEDRSLAGPGPNREFMPKQPTDTIRNGQPQAQPLDHLLALLRQALKFAKDFFVLIIRNARPRIPDINANHPRFTATTKQDSPLPGITDRIGKQILQHPPQQHFIRFHHRRARQHFHVQPQGLGQCGKLLPQGLHQPCQLERVHMDRHGIGIQFADLQQRRDDLFGRL